MDLKSKLWAGCVFFIAVLLLGGLATYWSEQRQEESAAAVIRSAAARDAIDDVHAAVLDVETGTRGFALAGTEAFLAPYHAGRARLPGALATLRARLADSPAAQPALARLGPLVDERLAISATYIASRRGVGLHAAAALLAEGRGKAATDAIRGLLDELQRAEQQRLLDRTRADRAALQRTHRVLASLFALAAVLVLVLTALLQRSITEPVRRLLAGLQRHARGDLDARVEPLARDELGRLAIAFNETVRQRRETEAELARTSALLDTVFRSSPLAIVAVDREGRVNVWNPAAERMFGWQEEEVMGRPPPVIPDEEREAFEALRERVLGRGEIVAATESRRRRRDGALVETCSSAAPLVFDGAIVGMMAVVEDISKRKQLVDELRDAEERFRLTLDEAPIGMAIVAPDGRFLRVNRVLCELTGYPPEELTAKTFQQITHPDDLDTDVALLARLARGEIPRYQLAKRYLRKDGTVVDILLHVSVVRGPDGAPRHYIAQIEDITERRRAEEALRRSEAQFRGLIDNMPDGVFVNRGGRIGYANQAFTTLLGYRDRGQLLGSLVSERFHPDDVAIVAERIRALRSGLPIAPRELRMARADHRYSDVETTGIQVRFDGEPAILVIVRDLTERKRAEREREAVLRRFETVVELAPVGIALSDDGRHWTSNRRGAQILGRPLDPRADLAEYRNLLLDASERPLPLDQLPSQQALAGEQVSGRELRLRRPDGRIVPITANAAPLPGSGPQCGVVVAFEDISAQKELERLRNEWNALIAHDLRQPLNSIDLYAQVLVQQTSDDPSVNRRVQQIRLLARRLNRMIQDLLDFSRLEARQLTLERRPVDLLEVIEEARNRTALEAPERTIEVRVDGAVGRVRADPDRVAQVLDNLLTNAVKYGDPRTPIEIAVRPRADVVEVAVTNRGPGIAPEFMPFLFARFQRAEDARRRGAKGIGLGLYISHELVQAHEGELTAESTPGGATTFRFTLPWAAEGAEAAPTVH